MAKPKVSILIPTLNEEKNIGRMIRDVKKFGKKYDLEILVVDGGPEGASADKTVEVAKKAGADKVVVMNTKGGGKGRNFWVGAQKATKDYLVQIDADYQFQPNEIPKFVKALEKGAEIAIGTRFGGGKIEAGSVKKINLFGNWLISAAAGLAAGMKITDIMAGFKGFKRKALLSLNLAGIPHFGYEAEVVIKGRKLGYKVIEIPITYKKRRGGVSTVKLKDGYRLLKTIFQAYFGLI